MNRFVVIAIVAVLFLAIGFAVGNKYAKGKAAKALANGTTVTAPVTTDAAGA